MAGRRRDVAVDFYALQAEKDAYVMAAESDGRNLSSWIRHVLNKAASEAGFSPVEGDKAPTKSRKK